MKQFWLSIRNNPFFVSAYSIFAGALAVQLQSQYSAGHTDFTVAGTEHMLAAAGITTLWSLAHLYLPKPGSNPKG